ncbi:hypothetical protein N7495_006348 [Penicillium taxi]|uniref:uncharacterized protein n=1 Tax=Penicillium taxi TaxID=168475 RepID=UPI0025450FE5|nr:uncharacterized protein N7495_006348 [Penicillium taxi]KAJ5894657.1 hypothetical protein N7495_006348 [Penicillium taxi]
MASPSTRRLLKESTDIHRNPSPYFTAAPISDTNLHDWHFTLAGPPSPTPYSRGLYHGRITFPPAYPLRPPSFRFLTPSGRFEVNREICLSISGHHEETWQPAWGVRTALLAIRSEIMTSDSKGQVGGMEGSDELRREFAGASGSWSCRECGGSNAEIMREWWGVCREMGGRGDANAEKESVKAEDETENETTPTVESEPVETAPVESVSAIVESAPIQSPGPAAPAQVQSTIPVPIPTPTPTRTVAYHAPNTSTAPASSPWLDRAIVVVAITLIIMVLRRVVGIEEL